MTIHEGAELYKRVERYEAAVAEMRASHQDIKDILTEQVLFERWRQLGAELGFSASNLPQRDQQHMPMTQLPEMSEAWS